VALTRHYSFVDYATQGYAAFVALLLLLFHNATVPNWPWIIAAHVTIILSVHVLLELHATIRRLHLPKAPSSSRLQEAPSLSPSSPAFKLLDLLRHFYPIVLFMWFYGETGWLNRLFSSDYMDPTIIRWEQAIFGFQPSVLFMHKLPYLLVSEIFYASYFCYYVMIAGIGLALYLQNRRHFFHYVSVISFVFYICYTLYILLPIVGPPAFFHRAGAYSLPAEIQQLAATDAYPASVQVGPFYQIMAFIYRVFEAPGAAFPSSHVAIALTTVYFSFRYLRKIRYVHLIVALLLCLATIYCRYHYALDVLSGALTAALLVPLANYLYFRSSNP